MTVDDSIAEPNEQSDGDSYFFITGKTTDGEKFRPSDWCDRLHSTLKALDSDEYEECVEYVRLINSKQGKGVLIDGALKETNPMLFNFFMSFVKNNSLFVGSYNKMGWESLKISQ